ncbi:hypothetical protein HZB93_00470 [Candidatus Falkowbacteria bacterium]|nr:hypothetical protein [Candidatus Falkowbacteria bacterium]
MAEKIKKGFFKVLPWSVVIFLVIGLVATFTMPTPQNPGVLPALAAQPTMSSAVTVDNNADGTVDRLVITFSENVDITDGNAGDGFPAITLAASSGTATIDNADYGALNVPTLTLNITVSATGNTAITIDPTYATAPAGLIADTATSTEMANLATVVGADGAKPAFISALTGDANSDGTVDRLVLTFSESSDVTDGNAGDGFPAITLAASSGTATIDNADYAAAATTTLTLNITTSVTANTALTVTPTYTTAPAGQIDDVAPANNEMANTASVAGTDGAAPAFISALTGDNNSDGTVDRLVMTFSEPVTVTDGGTDDDITLVASSGTATVTAGVYGAVGTTTLTYTISVSATGNTAITIDPTYATAGAGSISDTVNEMANGETVVGADGAAPAFISALTGDNNSDGTVDRLVLTFSESSDVTDGNAGDGFPAITLVASSGTATIDNANYAGTASAILNLNITVSATSNTAITVTPTYTVAAAGQIDDTSPANNEMADAETVAVTPLQPPLLKQTSVI